MRAQLTKSEKLEILASHFYISNDLYKYWKPKAGDYYCTARNDLELYQVVKIEGDKIYTRYCTDINGVHLEEWDIDGFTTKGFGSERLYINPVFLTPLINKAESPCDNDGYDHNGSMSG